jgi:hypothetical protein
MHAHYREDARSSSMLQKRNRTKRKDIPVVTPFYKPDAAYLISSRQPASPDSSGCRSWGSAWGS